MDMKESMLLEFRIMVFSSGGIVIDRGHKRVSRVSVMFCILVQMPIIRVGPIGRNSLICTLTICEFFSKHL